MNKPLKMHCLSITLVMVALYCGSGQAVASEALEEQTSFDIPALSLDQALLEFSRQADIQIVMSADTARNLSASAVKGQLENRDALEQLLANGGLEYTEFDNRTIAVHLAGESPVPGGDRDPGNVVTAQTSPTTVQRSQTNNQTTTESQEEAPSPIEEILVTGTHLSGLQSPGSRIITIDQQAIEDSGYTSTEQLIQSLPQNFRGGQAGATADLNLSTGSLRRLNGTAGSGVNLRGLGSSATLVLINGRRISASSAGTFTDISLIPVNAIERIEVLTDGASAIYGADAVAGVINVILRQDYDSADTRVRYGSASGRDEFRLTQNYGTTWNGGGLNFSLDYLDEGELLTSEREFTSAVIQPNSIFPANELKSLIVSGHQDLGDAVAVHADVQYSQSERFLVSGNTFAWSESEIKPERTNFNLGMEYEGPGDWNFVLEGSVSEEDTKLHLVNFSRDTGGVEYSYNQRQTQDQWSTEARADGPVFEMPGGEARLAVGLAYREEEYLRTIDLFGTNISAYRDVSSAFAELYLPLVGDGNARTGLHALELSLAGRFDDYSDFGSTENPRIGLNWAPIPQFELRGSYSTSFRAPSTGRELYSSQLGVFSVEIVPFFAADGNGEVPVALLVGSNDLEPEESNNWNVGFTWKPESVPGLSVEINYYDIDYSDRIVVPPLDYGALAVPELQAFVTYYDSPADAQAAINAYIDAGAFYGDFTGGMFGPDPLSQLTASYSYLWTNIDSVHVNGYDMILNYLFDWGENQWHLSLNANYIIEMVNIPAPGAPAYDLADTFGNPADLRLRGSLFWTRNAFSGALTVNYTDSYTDTSGFVDLTVDPYTTIDATLRYTINGRSDSWINGLSFSMVSTNLLDEDPPFVVSSGLGSNYDSANADPLGRVVALEVTKQW